MLVALVGFMALPALIGGCVADDSDDPTIPSDGQTSSESSTGTPNQDEPPFIPSIPADLPLQLILDSCIAIETLRHVLSDVVGATPPPTWGPGPTPATELRIEIFDCERLSIGPFERGPVQFLVEIHDNRDPPETCRGDYTSSEIITQVWVNDPELADYLRRDLGLPASSAAINRSTQQTGEIETFTWTFEREGSPMSRLETIKTRPSDTDARYLLRRFWVNEREGISYMDFEATYQRTNGEWPLATGTVADPFLHWPGYTTFVGTANILDPSSVVAPIGRFSDLKCEQPY